MLSFRVHEWYQHMTHLTQHEFEILTTHSTSFSVLKKKKKQKKNPAVPRPKGSEPLTHCHFWLDLSLPPWFYFQRTELPISIS